MPTWLRSVATSCGSISTGCWPDDWGPVMLRHPSWQIRLMSRRAWAESYGQIGRATLLGRSVAPSCRLARTAFRNGVPDWSAHRLDSARPDGIEAPHAFPEPCG